MPTPQTEPGGASAIVRAICSVEPTESATCTTSMMHSGVDQDVDVRVLAPGLFDLGHGEAGVNGAVALPQDEAGALQLLGRVAAQGLEGVPEHHLVQGET